MHLLGLGYDRSGQIMAGYIGQFRIDSRCPEAARQGGYCPFAPFLDVVLLFSRCLLGGLFGDFEKERTWLAPELTEQRSRYLDHGENHNFARFAHQ